MIDNILNSSVYGTESAHGLRSTHGAVLSDKRGGFEDILSSYLGRLLAEKGDPALLFDDRGESHQNMIDEIEENAREQRQVRREQQQTDIERKRRFSELREEDVERFRDYNSGLSESGALENADPMRVLGEMLEGSANTLRGVGKDGTHLESVDTAIEQTSADGHDAPKAASGEPFRTGENGLLPDEDSNPRGNPASRGVDELAPASHREVNDDRTTGGVIAAGSSDVAGLRTDTVGARAAESGTNRFDNREAIVRQKGEWGDQNAAAVRRSESVHDTNSSSEPGASHTVSGPVDGVDEPLAGLPDEAAADTVDILGRTAEFVEQTLEALEQALQGMDELRDAFDDVIDHLEGMLERIRTMGGTDTSESVGTPGSSGHTAARSEASGTSEMSGISGKLESIADDLLEVENLLGQAFEGVEDLPAGERLIAGVEQELTSRMDASGTAGPNHAGAVVGLGGDASSRPDALDRYGVRATVQPGLPEIEPGVPGRMPGVITGERGLASGAASEGRLAGATDEAGNQEASSDGVRASGRSLRENRAGRAAVREAQDASSRPAGGDPAQRAGALADRLRSAARLLSGDSAETSSNRKLVFDVRDFRTATNDTRQTAGGDYPGASEALRTATVEDKQDAGAAPPGIAQSTGDIADKLGSEGAEGSRGEATVDARDESLSEERDRFDILLGREQNAQSRGAAPSVEVEPTSAGSGARSELEQMLREQGNSEIVRQARVILKDNRTGELRLTLKPEGLGSVRIRMELEDNRVDLRILVENSNVRDAFRDNLAELQQAFEAEGFNTGEFSVDVNAGEEEGAGHAGYRDSTSGAGRVSGEQSRAMSELSDSVPSVDPYEGVERHVNVMV